MVVIVFQIFWAILLGSNLCLATETAPPSCQAQTLRSLSPSSTDPSTWNLMDPFDPEAWLSDKAGLDTAKLHVQGLKESHRWLSTTMQKLVNSPAKGPEKIAAFDRYVKQSAERTAELQQLARAKEDWSHSTLHVWKCRRFEVGGGVTVFVGDSGRALEFHPNGDIYRVLIRTGAGGALSPLWRPPYAPDGTPIFDTGMIIEKERWRLMPGEAPQ